MCVSACVSAVQLHAEVCYAECQLQRAALTFLQVQNCLRFLMITFSLLLVIVIHWSVFYNCSPDAPLIKRVRVICLFLI